jgi:hypothetical protein
MITGLFHFHEEEFAGSRKWQDSVDVKYAALKIKQPS